MRDISTQNKNMNTVLAMAAFKYCLIGLIVFNPIRSICLMQSARFIPTAVKRMQKKNPIALDLIKIKQEIGKSIIGYFVNKADRQSTMNKKHT